MADIESVKSKIYRAKEHYQAFTAAAERHLQGKAGRIVVEVNPHGSAMVVKDFSFPDLPPQIPLIVGDCLQNLRSSLDYLVWELCLASNAVPTDKNAFPICRAEKSFTDAVRRKNLLGVPEKAVTEIERLQPYHEGEHWNQSLLWSLNELSNINKHRRILVAELDVDLMSSRRVIGAVRRDDSQLVTGFGSEMEMNSEFVAFIAFKEGVANGAEVSSLLNQITEYIDTIVLPEFDRFFR